MKATNSPGVAPLWRPCSSAMLTIAEMPTEATICDSGCDSALAAVCFSACWRTDCAAAAKRSRSKPWAPNERISFQARVRSSVTLLSCICAS
jgi:hypothetical protein